MANGNLLLFNYYSDVEQLGGVLDYRSGFGAVRDAINRMVARWAACSVNNGATMCAPMFRPTAGSTASG